MVTAHMVQIGRPGLRDRVFSEGIASQVNPRRIRIESDVHVVTFPSQPDLGALRCPGGHGRDGGGR